jgi:hypothetical protein
LRSLCSKDGSLVHDVGVLVDPRNGVCDGVVSLILWCFLSHRGVHNASDRHLSYLPISLGVIVLFEVSRREVHAVGIGFSKSGHGTDRVEVVESRDKSVDIGFLLFEAS